MEGMHMCCEVLMWLCNYYKLEGMYIYVRCSLCSNKPIHFDRPSLKKQIG